MIPNRPNLERIVEYFSKHLHIDITQEDLLTEKIEVIIAKEKLRDMVKEPDNSYLTEEEKFVLFQYRGLDARKQKIIYDLLKDFE